MQQRGVKGAFPMDAAVSRMGLSPDETALLTDSAKEVTKQDLYVLYDVAKSFRCDGEDKVLEVFAQRTGLSLNIGDVSSISYAFEKMSDRRNFSQVAADSVSCCCTCTPCCSCTASVVIEACH